MSFDVFSRDLPDYSLKTAEALDRLLTAVDDRDVSRPADR
jgi:hypothetical protein